MKKVFRGLFVVLTATAFLFLNSCNKEDNQSIKEVKVSVLKASVTGESATKTLHQFQDKKLKVQWAADDEIAVSDGSTLHKFTQTGEITNNGHSATFTTDSPITISDGTLYAVYPYTTNLSYNLGTQSGTAENLATTDLLLATATVTNSVPGNLSFTPLCAILRFAQGTLITDADFSGNLSATLSGDNVGSQVTVAMTGGITITPSDIVISTSVTNGKLNSDLYVTFAPISKTNNYTYCLETDKEDFYQFNIENISTTKLYTVKEISERSVIFEDANFKKYCVENFDTNGDGEISYAEAHKVTTIRLDTYEQKIASLNGIQFFKNLDTLQCKGKGSDETLRGNLTQLDLGKNTALTYLHCSNNKLTSLDVSSNTALTILYCWSNNLTSLDVSKNLALTSLNCSNNQLTSLDVSKNTALKSLGCGENQIASLDLSKNIELTSLGCNSNKLTTLDLSFNTDLASLVCHTNQLASIEFGNIAALSSIDCYINKLTSLDVSKLTLLTRLVCYDNLLTNLNLNVSKNLTFINCSSNQLTSLDLSNNTALVTLYCWSNKLTSLDISKDVALKNLFCYTNQLSSLTLGNNKELTDIRCYSNLITDLDISNCTSLKLLYCYNNQLTTLDASKNTKLTTLFAWPQIGTLSTLYIPKGSTITYDATQDGGNTFSKCNPSDYGTTVIEVNPEAGSEGSGDLDDRDGDDV